MKNINVLVVDDEVDILNLFRTYLSYQGMDVTTAESGNAALALCQKHKFDCIITDERMPDGTGTELLQNLQKIRYQSVIIMVSAFSDTAEEDIIALGASMFITKPPNLKTIRQEIHRLCSGQISA